jgi:hypothetical protein
LNVKTYNLLNYKKQKYHQKSVVEKWYILTNLSSPEKIQKYIFREWELKQCLKTITHIRNFRHVVQKDT